MNKPLKKKRERDAKENSRASQERKRFYVGGTVSGYRYFGDYCGDCDSEYWWNYSGSKEDAVKADAIAINAAKTYVQSEGIPVATPASEGNAAVAAGVITADMLEPYIDGGEVTITNVTVSTNANVVTYEFTGSGVAGDTTITFTGATIDEINDDKDQTGTNRTIGS